MNGEGVLHGAVTGSLKFTSYFNEYFGLTSTLRGDFGSSGSSSMKESVAFGGTVNTLEINSERTSWQLASDILLSFKFPMKNNKLRFTAALGPVISFNKYLNKLSVKETNPVVSDQYDIEVTYGSIDAMVNLGMDYNVSENFCMGVFVGANSRGLGSFSKKTTISNSGGYIDEKNSKVNAAIGIRGGIGLSYKL